MWPGTGNKCKKCKAAGFQVSARHSHCLGYVSQALMA